MPQLKVVVGVAFRAKLMVVRVLGDDGAGSTGAVAEGIRYAAANGARVINLSFEFDSDTTRRDVPDLLAALRYANRHHVVVVGASGNSGLTRPRTEVRSFPADSRTEGVTESLTTALRTNPDERR